MINKLKPSLQNLIQAGLDQAALENTLIALTHRALIQLGICYYGNSI